MYPENDTVYEIIAKAEAMLFNRRLVDRVYRVWLGILRDGRFPSIQQLEPSMFGDDWPNCCLIAVRSPVQHSHFVELGGNLALMHCPNDSLAGVLLAHIPQVLSERRCLMIKGRAVLRGAGILYRSALFPLSKDGVAIDHILGAANHRPLRENEHLMMPFVKVRWL
jgi:hypothetical protein